MPSEKEFKSIADALAAAEKKQADKTAATLAARKSHVTRFATPRTASTAPAASPAKNAPAATNPADLRDDLDFAIEAVEAARKASARDPVLSETMAANLLMAKRQMPRAKATDLVKRAAKYLDR